MPNLNLPTEEIADYITDLFQDIQHGDQEQREWLQEKIKTWAWEKFCIVLTQDDLKIRNS